jgi:hypothetical protein
VLASSFVGLAENTLGKVLRFKVGRAPSAKLKKLDGLILELYR